jgi:hypothetical protein
MVNSASSLNDEKNQKNEKKCAQIDGICPSVGETITLRNAAIALAVSAPSSRREKLADDRLLNALRTGGVKAGFHCSLEPVLWVSVPKEYWINLPSDEFRKIRISPGKKNRTGAYKVKLKDFSKQYMSARLEIAKISGESSSDWIVEAFYEAIALLESMFEVVILLNTWTDYLKSQQATKPLSASEMAADERPGSGREAYSGWKKLNAHLAAHLVANGIGSHEEVEIKTVAATVYALVEKDPERARLPKLSSFEKEVSYVFDLVRRFRAQHD